MAETLESRIPTELPGDSANWLEHDGAVSDVDFPLDFPAAANIDIPVVIDDGVVLMPVDFSVRTPEPDGPCPWEAVFRTVPLPDPELPVVHDFA